MKTTLSVTLICLIKPASFAKNPGYNFAFHNESYEFNHSLDGTGLYDLLLQSTDKNLVAQQIDIGNMYEPGGRAMELFKKISRKILLLMHVKDEMKKDAPAKMEIYMKAHSLVKV